MTDAFIIGTNGQRQILLYPRMANRHGLIAGATGTGKTVTLQVLTEQFSQIGTPVFLVDVKGDLSGLAASGSPHAKIDERADKIGLDQFAFQACPVQFWDVFGALGTPIRTTVADMGPLLLSTLLGLNDTQAGVVAIAFAVAKDRELPLLNLTDLRAMLNWLDDNRDQVMESYGRVSSQSVGAILRRLLTLEESGGDQFFGEPALDVSEFLRCDANGQGIVNILAGDKLILQPDIYGTFLFWLMSALFEQLPEVGDAEKPKVVFFFDEAHLLFDRATPALLQRIEQVVRLIRSKGVGIYFVTQSPADIPDDVLGQLGNRVQHALRAFTPRDQKAVRTAAETFRPNPEIDVQQAITSMGVGEALVSVLDESGIPTPVEQTLLSPPHSQIGPIDPATRSALINSSAMESLYRKSIDRESAHERLNQRQQQPTEQPSEAVPKPKEKTSSGRRSNRQSYAEALGKSVLRSVGSQLGRRLAKSLVKALFRKGR